MEIQDSSGSFKINIAEPNLCIPQEILEEILSRLSVKPLLRFRCVSKLWLSVIDSKRFIKIHLKKSTENPCFFHHRIILNPVRSHHNRLLMMCYWRSLLQEPIVEPFEVDDQKRIDRETHLVGFCNGLVCLVQGERFILWNPSTRMSMDLPEVDVRHMNIGRRDFRMYGFGYDESSDDYKVFTIFASDTYPKGIGRVYSHNSHLWKTVEGNLSFNLNNDWDKAGKFVSGNLHWFGNNGKDPGIVSFNLKNDSYGMVEETSWSDYIFLETQTLGVIDGCLSMLCDYHNSHFEVWVMKQYGLKESWVNLFTISNFNHPPLRTQRLRSFCRGPNGEFLLIYSSTMMIYSYYPEDNEFRCSRIIIIDKLMEEGVYVESLVTPGPYAEEEDSF